ncbi:MAG TPA: M1 family aminopeptidase [Bryobacteraceae bacterium]|nr:M1 family aminopeptidase [Bryobacteraceae bacterium]
MKFPALIGFLVALSLPAFPQTHTAASLGRALREAGLNPAECYRVRDIEFSQEDAQFWLTSGYLIFGKPVNGAPVAALFTADIEGGDAEILLRPPDRSERQTLAAHTESPTLNEHFATAIFLFTDPHVRTLLEQVRSSGDSKKAPDIGALLAEQWNSTVGNIVGSFESRIVLDLLSGPGRPGFFDAILEGRKLGNFDVMYDSRAWEQINAGQVTTRDGRTGWETWTSFSDKSHRSLPPAPPEERIVSYKIDATLDPSLQLACVTRIRIQASADSRNVIAFDISGRMLATGAKVDGMEAEVYQRESLRSGYVQNAGNELLLVIPPQPLEPGSEHEIEIRHAGKVIDDTGHQVYFVSARGAWYPWRGVQFARYDVTYRYPKNLDLVSAGEVLEDRTEGDVRITHRVADGPIRALAFNLGRYERKTAGSVEVAANREPDEALRAAAPADTQPNVDPLGIIRRPRQPQLPVMAIPAQPAAPPRPADELGRIASEVGAAVDFFKARFGPPPLSVLEVSPVPGRFGQGFAGLVYISTLSYLPASSRPILNMRPYEKFFYQEMMPAHEVAHQWWGNVVTAGSYHHEWLMEALANYSALMFLESRQGPKVLDQVLDEYRKQLLDRSPDGSTVESEGPVIQGWRLESVDNPAAWNAIVYGKGTWIMHMLRRRMGDAQFLKMLAELRKRYEWKAIGTGEFRALCAEFLPPGSPDPKLEDFFDQWVYGTGIPTLKLNYSVTGQPGKYTLQGTVTQSDAADDLSLLVPVEIQTGKGKVVKQVRTGSGPVTFSVPVAAAGAKAVLDPGSSILRR